VRLLRAVQAGAVLRAADVALDGEAPAVRARRELEGEGAAGERRG